MFVTSDLKQDLPNFPEAVLESWLLPYANSSGWPPFSEAGEPEGRWRYLLIKRGKDYWQSIEWSLHTFHLNLSDLTPNTVESVAGIAMAAVAGQKNIFSQDIPDLAARFNRALSYLAANKEYPCPPTLLFENGKYYVLDGNHRVAGYALMVQQRKNNSAVIELPELTYWVGTEPNDSLKLTSHRVVGHVPTLR